MDIKTLGGRGEWTTRCIWYPSYGLSYYLCYNYIKLIATVDAPLKHNINSYKRLLNLNSVSTVSKYRFNIFNILVDIVLTFCIYFSKTFHIMKVSDSRFKDESIQYLQCQPDVHSSFQRSCRGKQLYCGWISSSEPNKSALSQDASDAYHNHGVCWEHGTERKTEVFTPSTAVSLYQSLLMFNQELDWTTAIGLLVARSLSFCHAYTVHALTHTLDIESSSRALPNWVSL